MRRLQSLRARLLAGVIVLATVGFLVLGAVIYTQQRSFLNERVDEQVRTAEPAVTRALVQQNATGSSDDWGGYGPGGRGWGGLGPGGRRPGGGPAPGLALTPGVYGEARDSSGKVVGTPVVLTSAARPSLPDLPADVPVDKLQTVESEDGSLDYRVTAFPAPGGGSTVVAFPLSEVDAQLDRLLVTEGAVIGVVLLLMGGLGFYVVRISLRPLDRIGETAGRIAAGDLSQRVSPADERTEVGRLGVSLNAMLHQIEEAFEERQESEDRLRTFLADASHELRTPLSSIRGYAELYRMGAARDPEGAEKAMSRIEQEAARMGVLVEDLLLLARLDEVREQLREPVDVTEIARDAVDDARAAAPDRPIALHAPEEDTVVVGDADQLRQVLLNLTRNALVHTPPGTPVSVAVTRPSPQTVRLEVRDDGPGLPTDEGDELFRRFWRADNRARGRGPAGAGLGLAIVHGIVTAHGGTVHAGNAPEGGARFTVDLPAGAPDRT
ncbi:MAG TPA: HAMP domain-containing sensor histidine kinase [Solirubrobacteraceae bacterium]|nr:HAMP domain-containing sensor histidine kinase [Solirubrobacteraceae bacterium]